MGTWGQGHAATCLQGRRPVETGYGQAATATGTPSEALFIQLNQKRQITETVATLLS